MTEPVDRIGALGGLLSWCGSSSSAFEFRDDLISFRLKADGNVSAVALSELPPDTVVVRVPSDLMFGPKQIRRKYKQVYNEIESKVRRYIDSVGGFLGGPEAEEAPLTLALAFGLLLELTDPASMWKPWWDALPEYVPSIFDLECDFSIINGSPWKKIMEERVQHMQTILNTIVVPIIERQKLKLTTEEIANGMKRAYGILQSRQFKDDMHGKRTQYLFPVLDMIEGESDRLSNVIVDDGPGSTPSRLQLVLKTSRKVEVGEELRQYYDSCANASYVLWYRFITDSMVFGNMAHRTFVPTPHILSLTSAFIDASDADEEVKEAKRLILGGLLNGHPGDAVELTHRQEALEDGAALVAAAARVATTTTVAPQVIKQLAEQVKKQAKVGADLIKAVNTLLRSAEASDLALETLDTLFKEFKHGQSLTEDFMEMDAPDVAADDRLLIKVRISEKYLLLRFRAELARATNAPVELPTVRMCDNCFTWRKLMTCNCCKSTPYCSRSCQVRKLREHKRLIAQTQPSGANSVAA